MKTRGAKRLDGWAQRGERGAQIAFAIAEVAAERDRDPDDRLLLPAIGQHGADAFGADRTRPDDVFDARGRLLEQTLMLDRLTEHEHRASCDDARASPSPPSGASARRTRQMTRVVRQDVPVSRSGCVLSRFRPDGRDGKLDCGRRHRQAQLLERGSKPREMRLLAGDHVLIGVVEIVVSDDAGTSLVTLQSAPADRR